MLRAAGPLTRWLDEPVCDRGIRFAAAGDTWDFWSYEQLAGLTEEVCRGLIALGVRRGDVVLLVLRSGPGFVAALFGALRAGATACPLPPPAPFEGHRAYATHGSTAIAVARPALVVAEADLTRELDAIGTAAGHGGLHAVSVETVRAAAAAAAPGSRDPAEIALVQFTSGSQGPPRGVAVPLAAIEANVCAIGGWLAYTESDATASWLPVHHDMGLIGCLLTPIAHTGDLWLTAPTDFVRAPQRYLRCFGMHGARLTAMPSFGLDHIVRRVRPEHLDGMDFRDWRAVIVGAERIEARTLDDFARLLGPHGLRRGALRPAYGLAEATLMATGLPLDETWTRVAVDPATLRPGRAVTDPPSGTRGLTVVGCGRPVDGVCVDVVDEAGDALPDGTVGEIVVSGPSVAAGYLTGSASPSTTTFSDGVLVTGDAGFRLDGQMYVLGRLGDSVKVHGRAVFAEEVEAAVSELGVPPHRVAAALGVHQGEPTVLVVFEAPDHAWLSGAEPLLRHLIAGARLTVLGARRGTVGRTTSGKPQRRDLWQRFIAGHLGGG